MPIAANCRFEPVSTDAAECMNGCFASDSRDLYPVFYVANAQMISVHCRSTEVLFG